MKLINGINTDVQPIDQPEGTWRDANNIVISKLYGAVSNDDGFKELLSAGNTINYPASEIRPIGFIPIDNPRTVVFSTDIAGAGTISEIGILQYEDPTTETIEAYSAEGIVTSAALGAIEVYSGRTYVVTITPTNASATDVVVKIPQDTTLFDQTVTSTTAFQFLASQDAPTFSVTNSNAGNPIDISIKVTETLEYKRILRDNVLAFDVNYPVSGTYKQNIKGERIIAFTDDNSPPKILNIDDPGLALSVGKSIIDDDKEGLLNMFVDAEVPTIDAEVNNSGGQLETGTYWGCFSYELPDGSATNVIRIVNPVYITDQLSSNDFAEVDGTEPGEDTSKSITYTLKGLDQKFDKIRFYVIKMVDQIITSEYVGVYNVSTTSRLIEYTGTEDTEDVELSEILVDNSAYSKIKTMENLNNRLYIGNTETVNVVDYQKYANNINIDWVFEDEVSIDQVNNSSKDGTFTFAGRGFKDDEIYAFYIAPILKNGIKAPAFHIPGRAMEQVTIEGTAVTIDENALCANYVGSAPQLAEDVKLNSKAKYYQTRNTAQSDGTMGYWENQDEYYPTTEDYEIWETDGSGGGQQIAGPDNNLGGQRVRHHKFPSLRQLKMWGNDPYRDNSNDTPLTNSGEGTASGEAEFFVTSQRIYGLFNSSNVTGGVGTWSANPSHVQVTNTVFTSNYTGTATVSFSAMSMFIQADQQGPVALSFAIKKITATHEETLVSQGALSGTGYAALSLSSSSYVTDIKAGESIQVIAYGDKGDLPYGTIYGDFFDFTLTDYEIEIVEELPAQAPTVGSKVAKVLGIKVSNVYFPDEIKDKIQGYEIMYARRTAANQSVISQGMYMPHREHADYQDKPIPDFLNFTEGGTTYKNPFRFHGFDLMATATSVIPTHVTTQLAVHTIFNEQGTPDITNLGERKSLFDCINDTVDGDTYNTLDMANRFYMPAGQQTNHLRVLKNTKYMLTDNSATKPSNEGREFCLFGETDVMLNQPAVDHTGGALASNSDVAWIVNMNIYKTNIYVSLIEQELVSTGKVFKISDTASTYSTGNLYGGDTFIYPYSFRMSAYHETPYDSTNLNPGQNEIQFLKWYYFPAQGALNGALRNEGEEWYETYYPKKSVHLKSVRDSLIPNGTLNTEGYDLGPDSEDDVGAASILFWGWRDVEWIRNGEPWYYNNDYTAIHQYAKTLPYDPDTATLKFPTRIARSEVSGIAEDDESWRNFLPLDNYEMPRKRGELVKIVAYNDQLLVHHEEGLYRTVASTTIDTSEVAAELGTGDIFRIVPQEILPSAGGYAGIQHNWSSILTKAGYFFVDAAHGKVFLLSDKLDEISNRGMRNYFLENLSGVNDNPFNTDGLIAAYDEKFNRIMFSRVDGSPYTLSYSLDVGKWISFHDFAPQGMWNTRNKMYSYAPSNKIYQHNDPTTKATYYDDTQYKSHVTPVFNQPAGPKYYGHIAWITEVIKQDNTNLYDETLSEILVYTKRQCSGEITLANRVNMRKFKNVWVFNGFRDIVIDNSLPFIDTNGDLITSNINYDQPWWKQRRMEDHYLVAKLVYDNVGDNNLYLYNTEANVREPIR